MWFWFSNHHFQNYLDFDFIILNHLYLGDLILILKSSTYDDFAQLCSYRIYWEIIKQYKLLCSQN